MLHPRGRPYFRDNDTGASWGASQSVRFYKMEETIEGDVSVTDLHTESTTESPYPSFISLKRRVWALIDDNSHDNVSDTQMGVYINDGEYDVAVKSLCLRSTTSVNTTGSQRYASADYMKILYAEYSNIELVELPPTTFGHMFSTTPGAPKNWVQYDSFILFDPVPDNTYSVTLYVATPPSDTMTDNDDIPQIPAAFIPLIVMYAYYRCLLQLGKYSDAKIVYSRYISTLDRIRNYILTHIADIVRDMKLHDAARRA